MYEIVMSIALVATVVIVFLILLGYVVQFFQRRKRD